MVSGVFGILWWRVGRLYHCYVAMFAFVAFTIVHEHGGQIPVQRYVTLVHAEAMCLRCVCVVLKALLAWPGVAWRSSSIAFLLVLSKFFLVEVVFATVVPRCSCCGLSSAGEFLVVL